QFDQGRLVVPGHIVTWTAVVIAQFHIKATGAAGNGLANASQAHNAQLLAADPCPKPETIGSVPQTSTHVAIRFRHTASRIQHQGPGHIGHAIVQNIRSGTDLNTALFGGLYVDGVVAYPYAANRFQSGQAVHQGSGGSSDSAGQEYLYAFDLLGRELVQVLEDNALEMTVDFVKRRVLGQRCQLQHDGTCHGDSLMKKQIHNLA